MKNVYFVYVPDVMFEYDHHKWAYEYAAYVLASSRSDARLTFTSEYELPFIERLSIRKVMHDVETNSHFTGSVLPVGCDLFKQADTEWRKRTLGGDA